MKLHEDKAAFDVIIQKTSENSGISPSIIEKDYYVSLILKEISDRQNVIPAIFKGGTCLYKVYTDMKRFSEDIDLTVDIRNISGSQAKRRLEKAAQSYFALSRIKGDPLEENHKGSITSIYGYDALYEIPIQDRLQRYGKVKVEATSFTISEPKEVNNISSLIYQYASDADRTILKNEFGIGEFPIQNISIERMFADKLLAAEFYLQRKEYFDVSKHLYDISVMLQMDRIQSLLDNDNEFIHSLSYKREEERYRIGSDLSRRPLDRFELFNKDLSEISALSKNFSDMQRIYVIHDKDIKDFAEVIKEIDFIKNICFKLSDLEKENNKLGVFLDENDIDIDTHPLPLKNEE